MSLLDTASLIVTPNGYKESKLYSVIPSDGSGDMSVVRATTATRVNSAGLVELVPYNLLGYSQDFTNASWLKGASTITGNTTTAPDGTLTADTFTGNGASDLHIVLWQTDVIGVGNTISVYAKKNTNDFLQIYTDFVNTDFANFNLANGTTGSVGSSVISSSIQSVGNGWYRCSFVVGSSVSKFVNFCLVTSASVGRAETNSLSTSVFLWGAQLNEGSLKDYQKTETRLNIPRLDYSNGTCPSLLVEPQRTNLALQSNSAVNSTVNVGYSAMDNNTTSPDGTANAARVLEDTSTLHLIQKTFSVATTTTPYSVSFFVKANGRTSGNILYGLNGAPFSSVFATFNLSNGTITAAVGDSGATAISSSIEDFGNGWFRVSVSGTIPTAGTHYVRLQDANGGAAGDPSKGFFVYGFQAEAGSYATSYIPTTSASVTRNADVISKTGISSLIGQTEGTIFVDCSAADLNTFKRIAISSGSYLSSVYLDFRNDGSVVAAAWTNAGLAFYYTITPSNPLNRNKYAIGYKANDWVVYVNGSLAASQSSGGTTFSSTLSTFELSLGGNDNFFGDVNAAALWKTRLTNAQLATLTTL